METNLPALNHEALTPVRSDERIQALDVVRGLALLGIFLMNIEWFNRPSGEMMNGLPLGLTGANWWASRLIYVLVQGKFWTMFSLLFGMGFAVMLTRAERAGRNFLRPYLRRIAALAIFGAAHHILIWNGDILFSYALGAVTLLAVLYGTWRYIGAALVALVVLGFFPKLHILFSMAGGLAIVSIVALFLRSEKRMSLRGHSLPVFSFVVLVLGALMATATAVLWALPHGPKEPRLPLTIMSMTILALGLLSARYHNPVEERPRRLGLTLYFLPFLMATIFGAVQYFTPIPPPSVQAQPAASAAQPAPPKPEANKLPKTAAERKIGQEAAEAKWLEKHNEEIRTETRILSKGTYREAVKLRALQFVKHFPNEMSFAIILSGMFLLGAWFIRSGVMADPRAHLPLFRKLAWIALPVGVGLGLLGASIATSGNPLNNRDGFQMASGLLMLGNLPASLGYMGLIVLMLNSGTVFSKIRVLAPVGRMALTNYLTQSVLGAFYFFGHGLGHWGLGRAWQVMFVVVVFSAQVLFSHWWLGRYRYGPMEWLWRAITYWTLPGMSLKTEALGDPLKPLEAPAS